METLGAFQGSTGSGGSRFAPFFLARSSAETSSVRSRYRVWRGSLGSRGSLRALSSRGSRVRFRSRGPRSRSRSREQPRGTFTFTASGPVVFTTILRGFDRGALGEARRHLLPGIDNAEREDRNDFVDGRLGLRCWFVVAPTCGTFPNSQAAALVAYLDCRIGAGTDRAAQEGGPGRRVRCGGGACGCNSGEPMSLLAKRVMMTCFVSERFVVGCSPSGWIDPRRLGMMLRAVSAPPSFKFPPKRRLIQIGGFPTHHEPSGKRCFRAGNLAFPASVPPWRRRPQKRR